MGAADLMPPPEGVNHMRSGGLVTTLESVAKRLLDTQVAGFTRRAGPETILHGHIRRPPTESRHRPRHHP